MIVSAPRFVSPHQTMFHGSRTHPHDGVLHLFLNLVGSEPQKTEIVFSPLGSADSYAIGLLMDGIRRNSPA